MRKTSARMLQTALATVLGIDETQCWFAVAPASATGIHEKMKINSIITPDRRTNPVIA